MKQRWKDTLPDIVESPDLAYAAFLISHAMLPDVGIVSDRLALAHAGKIIRNYRKSLGEVSERVNDILALDHSRTGRRR